MYELKIKEKLSGLPVFRLGDVNQIVENRIYAKKIIKRMLESGMIFKIKKGLYTFYDDPFMVSTFILKPSYVSSVSALYYFHRITQIPRHVFCSTPKRTKTYYFITQIHFLHTDWFFGFELIEYKNFKIPVATPEKAIIDSIGNVPLSLIEEAFDEIDIERMLTYLKKIKKSCVVKRIGYFLEMSGHDVYSELKEFINPKYIHLDPLVKGKVKNRRWRVVI
jgi:predicted transcriptional regulator of viral defense system